MKIYTFNNDTADIIKRFNKKEFWMHTPSSEPKFKEEPYIEIYLENFPKKNHVTAVRVSFKELKEKMDSVKRK